MSIRIIEIIYVWYYSNVFYIFYELVFQVFKREGLKVN